MITGRPFLCTYVTKRTTCNQITDKKEQAAIDQSNK